MLSRLWPQVYHLHKAACKSRQIASFWNLLDQTITFPDTCILEAFVIKEKYFARMEQKQRTKGVKCQHPRPESVLGGMEFIQNGGGVGGKPFF